MPFASLSCRSAHLIEDKVEHKRPKTLLKVPSGYPYHAELTAMLFLIIIGLRAVILAVTHVVCKYVSENLPGLICFK